MHSYEDRSRAVELYFLYDKKASVVIRVLGYPSIKQLGHCVRNYEETGDLPTELKSRQRYSLDDALDTLREHERPVIHRDSHYRWPGWLNRINASGLKRSTSRKCCSSGNAACEGSFGRVKNEIYDGRNWASMTQEEFICFLYRYIRWYNEKRIKLLLGAMSPVKYRQHLEITT